MYENENNLKIPAAMYIRMSTEHQKYSPENQAAAIREYAERNGYEIIQKYADEGKSGLNIAGTLYKGFELYKRLDNAFSRAVFMMFMVSEVHPFNDGNSRLSRIMMNAELIAAGEQRIIIPTVFRQNYLQSLKALSHNSITDAFIKTLDFAQRYTGMIDWSDITRATDMLQETNAFIDSSEDENARLKLPGKF